MGGRLKNSLNTLLKRCLVIPQKLESGAPFYKGPEVVVYHFYYFFEPGINVDSSNESLIDI